MKCDKNLFIIELLKNNIGNYTLSSIIIINFPFIIIFIFKEFTLIFTMIDKLISYKNNQSNLILDIKSIKRIVKNIPPKEI